MRRWILALACSLAAVMGAGAQVSDEDPMEVQRCIWRCLADANGADDPAYGQCVAAKCNGEPTAEKKAPSRKSIPRGATKWQHQNPTRHQSDLIISSVDQDFSIDLSCRRRPGGSLSVHLYLGYTVEFRLGNTVTLYVDGNAFDVQVDGTEDGVMLNDDSNDNVSVVSAAFLDRLRSGSLLTITGKDSSDQPRVAVFDIAGGGSVFQDFEAACRKIRT